MGSHWERSGSSLLPTGEDLTPALEAHPEVGIRTVRWEETGSSALLHQYSGRVSLRFRGIEREVAVPLTVKVDHHTCPECSRKSGHYYTAQLQLRGTLDGPREKAGALRARLDAQWDELMHEARADWRKAISWREALPEGWDYFLVNTMAARSLARLAQRRLAAEMKESATLYGRKDGQDLYRVTICVRIPPSRREAAVGSS
ncbi:NMD3 family protein [mine drainage metagenome]|uniref:NMD3 family protein n=1 Tax=mine drainage metagenome TaxID=410659 RepID=T1DD69_9ZZZZ